MIQIAPAILTNSKAEFRKQLNDYSEIFELIDIDINEAGDRFEGDETVSIDFILTEIQNFSDINFTFHLMLESAETSINKIRKVNSQRILIHQKFLKNYSKNDFVENNIGIVVNPDDKFLEFDFYNNFPEVQFMTVHPGSQGNMFQENVLSRVEELRRNGYRNTISIDGSVNSETANLIKNYQLDKVSVGSYLSKAENLQENAKTLHKILNAS